MARKASFQDNGRNFHSDGDSLKGGPVTMATDSRIALGRAADWKARCNTDAGSSPWCSKGFVFLSTFSADSHTAFVQPKCAVTCINICAHVKNLKHWLPYHCLDTGEERKKLHTYTHWEERTAPLLQLLRLTLYGNLKDSEVLKKIVLKDARWKDAVYMHASHPGRAFSFLILLKVKALHCTVFLETNASLTGLMSLRTTLSQHHGSLWTQAIHTQ